MKIQFPGLVEPQLPAGIAVENVEGGKDRSPERVTDKLTRLAGRMLVQSVLDRRIRVASTRH